MICVYIPMNLHPFADVQAIVAQRYAPMAGSITRESSMAPDFHEAAAALAADRSNPVVKRLLLCHEIYTIKHKL